MLAILAITFPFFVLVLCGYIAVRRHMLPQIAIPGMNSFVLYFALPCLLYRFGSATPLAQLLDPGLCGVYLVCAVLMVALVVAATLGRRRDWNNAAFGALVAAFPNTGFMGVPLLVALLGARAAGPVIVTIVIDLVITTSLCIALSRLGACAAEGVETERVGKDPNSLPLSRTVAVATAGEMGAKWDFSGSSAGRGRLTSHKELYRKAPRHMIWFPISMTIRIF